MLDAESKLRAVWNGFTAQLAKDAALMAQRVRPTGQAIAAAAGKVHEAASPCQADSD